MDRLGSLVRNCLSWRGQLCGNEYLSFYFFLLIFITSFSIILLFDLYSLSSLYYVFLLLLSLALCMLGFYFSKIGRIEYYLIFIIWMVMLIPSRVDVIINLTPIAGPAGVDKLNIGDVILISSFLIAITTELPRIKPLLQLVAMFLLLTIIATLSILVNAELISEYGWGLAIRGILQYFDIVVSIIVWAVLIRQIGIDNSLKYVLFPILFINLIFAAWRSVYGYQYIISFITASRGAGIGSMTINALAMSGGILLFGGLYLIFKRDTKWGYLLIITSLLLLLFTSTRSASAAIALAIILILWRSVKFIYLILMVLLGYLYVLYGPFFGTLGLMLWLQVKRLLLIPDIVGQSSLAYRFIIWERGYQLFLSKPLLGNGAGSSYYLTPVVFSLDEGEMIHFVNFHNIIVETAAVMGIAGLVLLLLIFIWFGTYIFLILIRKGSWSAKFAAGSLIVVLITNQADILLFSYKAALIAGLVFVWFTYEVNAVVKNAKVSYPSEGGGADS